MECQHFPVSLHLETFADLEAALAAAGYGVSPALLVDAPSSTCTLSACSFGSVGAEDGGEQPQRRRIPASVQQDTLQGVMDVAMARALAHWCCIAFKVAPVALEDVRRWKQPSMLLPIPWCIAAISLISLSCTGADEERDRRRDAAIALYQRARHGMDAVALDDTSMPTAMMVQTYFCLSYTSNLLGFHEHQRTWASLAATALIQSRAAIRTDRALLRCWYRWYYVDAWVSLTSSQHRLLPDELPSCDDDDDDDDMRPFAVLAHYMRRRQPSPADNSGSNDDEAQSLINDLDKWWHSRKSPRNSDPHLHLCFYAMRLLVLFQQLAHPQLLRPAWPLLAECLYTNLQLLSGLQHLRDTGCDHSTYHRLFLAIHNTARGVFLHTCSPGDARLRKVAVDQLQINVELMESTVAYAYDVYCIRRYAAQCRRDAASLGVPILDTKQQQQQQRQHRPPTAYRPDGRHVGNVLFRVPKLATLAPCQHHPSSALCYDGIHVSTL